MIKKTWWNGVGPMPDDEREFLVSLAMKRDPSLTREVALRTIGILEAFEGAEDLKWLGAMKLPAAEA